MFQSPGFPNSDSEGDDGSESNVHSSDSDNVQFDSSLEEKWLLEVLVLPDIYKCCELCFSFPT